MNLEVSYQREQFPSLGDLLFCSFSPPLIELRFGRCGGAQEGPLGTDAGVGGARAQPKELLVACVYEDRRV